MNKKSIILLLYAGLYISSSFAFDYSKAVIKKEIAGFHDNCLDASRIVNTGGSQAPYNQPYVAFLNAAPYNDPSFPLIDIIENPSNNYTGVSGGTERGYLDEPSIQSSVRVNCTEVGIMLNNVDYPTGYIIGGGSLANYSIETNEKVWSSNNDETQLTVQVQHKIPWINNSYKLNVDVGFTLFFRDYSLPANGDAIVLVGAGILTTQSKGYVERIDTDGNWDYSSSYILNDHKRYITKSPYSASALLGENTSNNYKLYRFHVSAENMLNVINDVNNVRRFKGNQKPQLSTNLTNYKLGLVLAGVEISPMINGVNRKGSVGMAFNDLKVFTIYVP